MEKLNNTTFDSIIHRENVKRKYLGKLYGQSCFSRVVSLKDTLCVTVTPFS